MLIERIHIVYFSPTQSTKRIAHFVSQGLNLKAPISIHSQTEEDNRRKNHDLGENDLALFALPSYGGRVPKMEVPLLLNFTGNKTPAIFICVYGNRGYDDTLLEFRDILIDRKFVPIAGAAFVAQHASNPKVGAGRPDANDIHLAKEFGKKAAEKIYENDFSIAEVPGNNPYKELPPRLPFSFLTNENCIHCSLCFRWCPTNSIAEYDPKDTNINKCILCQGCVRRCPVSAREVVGDVFKEKVLQLEAVCADNDLKPEFFL